MHRAILLPLLVGIVFFACAEKEKASNEPIVAATTTSAVDSGLMQIIATSFERQASTSLRWHSVGSGRALAMALKGEVGVAITHDPDAERAAGATGRVLLQRPFARNDFVIVGPAANPAGVLPTDSAVEAFRKIHASRSGFCSRGDSSGTHAREKRLWKMAAIDPATNASYVVSGQPMGALLRSANDLGAYALTDRATFVRLGAAIQMKILSRGDPALSNIYVITVMRASQNRDGELRFANWLVAPEGTAAIRSLAVAGEPLFQPLAL